jgi:tRNA threonylcarbamoyladenosine biosynthesis protein TsaE
MINKISKNTENTEEIAKEFTKVILPNKNSAVVVCLYGDLGTGKTTFSQFLAKNLGVKRKVNSPTFVIMKKYELPSQNVSKNFLANKTKPVSAGENFHKHSGFKYLYHLDAYRLKNHKELLVLGWEELILNPENLILIEWPENVIKAIPKKHHKIHISHTKQGHRSFKIKS